MSPAQKQHKQKVRKKFFRKWHRRIGFAASIFLFNLAITGILLNHYEELELHKKHIQSNLLLDWYGVKAPNKINCAKIKSTDSGQAKNIKELFSVCHLGEKTYLIRPDKSIDLLFSDHQQLISLVKNTHEIFLLTDGKLSIYDLQFELIDSIELTESEFFQNPSDKVKAALIVEEQLLIKTTNNLYRLDESSYEFEMYNNELSPLPFKLARQIFPLKSEPLIQLLKDKYRSKQITQLKFIQDLHSGQILMLPGKLLTDLTGLIIMLLAISGFITWHRRKNNQS